MSYSKTHRVIEHRTAQQLSVSPNIPQTEVNALNTLYSITTLNLKENVY